MLYNIRARAIANQLSRIYSRTRDILAPESREKIHKDSVKWVHKL